MLRDRGAGQTKGIKNCGQSRRKLFHEWNEEISENFEGAIRVEAEILFAFLDNLGERPYTPD